MSTSDTWLPAGAWDGIATERIVEDGTAVVLAFDGSFNGDCTAIVGVTVDEVPHAFVVEAWESLTMRLLTGKFRSQMLSSQFETLA
jgi:hypothetical protein